MWSLLPVAAIPWRPEGVAQPAFMALAQDYPIFLLTGGPPLAGRGDSQLTQPTHLFGCLSYLIYEVSQSRIGAAQGHSYLLPAWNIMEPED